jgi:hypothetical protein
MKLRTLALTLGLLPTLVACSSVGVGISIPIGGIGSVGVSVGSDGRVGGGVSVGVGGVSVGVGGTADLPKSKPETKAPEPAASAASAPR